MSRPRPPGRAWRLPPRTVRLRLSALYGSLFLASGAGLLAVTYALVAPWPSLDPTGLLSSGQVARAREAVQQILGSHKAETALRNLVANQRMATLHQLLLACLISLAITTVASAWLGWLVAGRALRPLRVMTAKTRQISDRNLHERLALPGPDDELKELGGTIDELLTRLEAAFTAQRQFVANASHELRTPLTLERAAVEITLADPHASAKTLRATCQQVLTACAQQEQIIDALLTLARGQRGLDRREPFDLDAIAVEVLAARASAAERAGLRTETSLRPAPTAGDPQLAERLVANLIDNAITHNASGGWITVHTASTAGRAVLLVANSGPVIDPGDVGRLLRPFERLETDRTGRRTGLGLAIVAAIADAHDATLTIRPPRKRRPRNRTAIPFRRARLRDSNTSSSTPLALSHAAARHAEVPGQTRRQRRTRTASTPVREECLSRAMHEVGAVLDAKAVHGGHGACNQCWRVGGRARRCTPGAASHRPDLPDPSMRSKRGYAGLAAARDARIVNRAFASRSITTRCAASSPRTPCSNRAILLQDESSSPGRIRRSPATPMRKTGFAGLPGPMIEIRGLSKRYGDRIAVDDLSFTIRPGHVTGFPGPNGAGKSDIGLWHLSGLGRSVGASGKRVISGAAQAFTSYG